MEAARGRVMGCPGVLVPWQSEHMQQRGLRCPLDLNVSPALAEGGSDSSALR